MLVQPVIAARMTSPCLSVYGTPSSTKLSSVVSSSALRPKPFNSAHRRTFAFIYFSPRDYSMWAWSPTPLRKNKLWGPRVRGFACWMPFLSPNQQSLTTKGKYISKFMPHYMRLSKWTVSIYTTILSFLLTAIFQVDLG